MRASALAVVLLGCGAGSEQGALPRVAPGTPLPPEPPASVGVPPEPSPVPPTLSLRVEPLDPPRAPSPGPRVEIVQPASGEKLETLGAARYEVRVASSELPEGAEVRIALDGQRPRRVPEGGKLALADLQPPGVPLAPGSHTVLAVVVDGSGLAYRGANDERPPFALTEFVVGERKGAPLAASTPRLWCLAPSGTHYGEETERLVVDLFPVGPLSTDTLPVRVVADSGTAELRLDPRRPHALGGLPGGDVRVVAGGDGTLPRAECVTTLNPEVERAEER
ncbi:MAG TPA: hypothetical protein VKY73_19675 [Polyangiaceae bacterium]|nr:hypothetical protein [Polyangiaceae bacterium]